MKVIVIEVDGGQVHWILEAAGRRLADERCSLGGSENRTDVAPSDFPLNAGPDVLCGHCFPAGVFELPGLAGA